MPSSNVTQPIPRWSALSIFDCPLSRRSVPTSLMRRRARDRARLEGGHGGHHLEHGTRLVDARDDRVDEPARRLGRDGPVVVRVVRRIGRLGVDGAGVRVQDDRRHALRLIGDPRREQLLLEGQLEAGVDRETDVLADRARRLDDRRLGHRPPVHVALGDHDPRRAGEGLLVGLLDAVLAVVLAVDEAEQMGSQRGLGSAARLRIDPLRLGLEGDVDDPLVPQRLTDALGHGRLDAARDDDVRPLRGELLAQRRGLRLVELEEADELVAGPRPSRRGRVRAGPRRRPDGPDRSSWRAGRSRSGHRCRRAGRRPRCGPSSGPPRAP